MLKLSDNVRRKLGGTELEDFFLGREMAERVEEL